GLLGVAVSPRSSAGYPLGGPSGWRLWVPTTERLCSICATFAGNYTALTRHNAPNPWIRRLCSAPPSAWTSSPRRLAYPGGVRYAPALYPRTPSLRHEHCPGIVRFADLETLGDQVMGGQNCLRTAA